MNPRLIGGEMLLWSDLDGAHSPAPVGGKALARLLFAVSGRTLVVGPHAPSLIDTMPTDDVTVVVRGLADAEGLAARYADRPGVAVWCGSLEKVAAVPAFDTVVALDGLSRVGSAETADSSWEESLALLLSLLGRQGRLLLGMENLVGVHRLVALAPEPTDADWTSGDEYDLTRPTGAARLRHRLQQAGLDVVGDYAAYPRPTAPTALLSDDVLADRQLGGFLEATLARAVTTAGPMLSDPNLMAVRAVRHGIAAELAPGCVVVAERAPTGRAPALPEAIVATDGVVYQIRRDAARRWTRSADDTDHPETLPLGPTLEHELLGASSRQDLPRLRALLGSWQGGEAAGVPADQVIVDDDEQLHALARAGEPAAALHGLAAAFIDQGFAHLWPAPADTIELTGLLAAMAGKEFDSGILPATAWAERPPADGVRELTMARDRLLRELTEARAKQQWYEEMLTTRDAALKRANRLNAALSATVPGRAATTVIATLRGGRRLLRGAARRALPRR